MGFIHNKVRTKFHNNALEQRALCARSRWIELNKKKWKTMVCMNLWLGYAILIRFEATNANGNRTEPQAHSECSLVQSELYMRKICMELCS